MYVFAAAISENSEIQLDDENTDFKFITLQDAALGIGMPDQADFYEKCLEALKGRLVNPGFTKTELLSRRKGADNVLE